MRKILLSIFIFIIFLVLAPTNASAQDTSQFSVDTEVTYEIAKNGVAKVISDIVITNNTSTYYASSYNIILHETNPEEVVALEDGRQIPVQKSYDSNEDKYTLSVRFPNPVLGEGKSRSFRVIFTNNTIAQKTGEVWEISIPRLADDNYYRNYKVILKVDSSFGKAAYVSPSPIEETVNNVVSTYTFSKEDITKIGVTAAFGQFQVFAFDLTYHVENPVNQSTFVDIALPPDTAFQKVIFSSITPSPKNISLDSDSNFIAKFELTGRQRLDIRAIGHVQLFSTPKDYPPPTQESLMNDLKPTKYWQIENSQISKLAETLKTPQQIYDFVSKTLTYDYSRVKPNVERLGAVEALNNPKNAICMEFTDLFIAIARAAGIPAREVNGYAYTQNQKLQPLSLVADVLHAWPEYWDNTKNVWIPVDPTWGSTSGGVDYFNKLDLRHITFVIHGKDPVTPYPPGSYKLGTSPQKDVFVSVSELPTSRTSLPKLTITSVRAFPFANMKLTASIYNPGPSSFYQMPYEIYFDKDKKISGNVAFLPPFASFDQSFEVPIGIFGKGIPSTVTLSTTSKSYILPTYKNYVSVVHLLFVSIILLVIVFFLYTRYFKKARHKMLQSGFNDKDIQSI